MHRTTIILPPSLKLKLNQEAQKNHQSFGALVRNILERYMAARRDPFAGDSFFNSRTAFHDEAATDVALNHDAYLYGGQSN
jgi:hypothetical protein